jgi:hypothetical protein
VAVFRRVYQGGKAKTHGRVRSPDHSRRQDTPSSSDRKQDLPANLFHRHARGGSAESDLPTKDLPPGAFGGHA